MNPSSQEKIFEILQTFHTAMLVTHASGAALHGRPMEIAQSTPDCHVWFFTDGNSPKTREIRQEDEVLLTFQKDHQRYLTLNGVADLVTDRAMMEAFWKETYRVWFPGGLEDSSLTLVQVIPHTAEYWDSSGLKGAHYLYEAAKAYVTGSKPDVDEDKDQHGKLHLA